jgi:hypothetical protein
MNFSDLILLIGTNPLPNLVVSLYFLRHNSNLKNIWLIYSEKNKNQRSTLDLAENLKSFLENKYSDKVLVKSFPLTNIGSAKEIKIELNDLNINNGASVHLNYTCGTKVMVNQIYQFINLNFNNKSFSYLDARSFKIIYDEEGNTIDDLRNEIKISFEDIIKLHGFRKKSEKDNELDFSEAVKSFSNLINQGKLSDYFNNESGYKRELFESKKKKGQKVNLAEKVNELNLDSLSQFKPNETFLSVITSMPEGCRLFNGNGEFTGFENNNTCKHSIRFLDGSWLEEYVYKILYNKFQNKMEILKNWEITKDEWKTYFELDVILIKSYQLIGISCTTASYKDLCKSKGFEIVLRTKQIGGDEAKSILITRCDEKTKKDLEDELVLDTGTDSKILVLGIEDLKEEKLLSQITNFIEN